MPVNPRYVNTSRTGDVWLEDFDVGLVETLGGVVVGKDYYINVAGVPPTPWTTDRDAEAITFAQVGDRMPGIMVTFASPDDRIVPFVYPVIVVRRESIDPAPQRWPANYLKYRAPADGASQVQVQFYNQDGSQTTLSGYDKYEEQRGGHPYDITYMISVLADGERAETYAQMMLKHVLRVYPPRNGRGVRVKDSIGDTRLYEVFSEGPATLREALDLVDHQAGYSINVRVEGELDLNDPYLATAVQSLDFRLHNGVN